LKHRTISLTDRGADEETKALYKNLLAISGKGILFGQQDALYYGIGWQGEKDRSDVKSVTGSHPAVFGWDLQKIVIEMLEKPEAEWKETTALRHLIKEAYDKGGVNTLSWHMQNFVTGESFYDTTRCVPSILPRGRKHEDYNKALDQAAEFIRSLKGSDGAHIPIIFRPFHEHTGNWFWWGKPHCTVSEYKELWRYTVHYLRDKKQLHNILYAYSPDRIGGKFEEYMERYPGDGYVDILGFDNYWEFKDRASFPLAVKSLALICRYARSKNKPAALTETGLEKITDKNWFTEVLNSIKADKDARYISYMMVWRNAHTGHFYAPYPGHQSEADFIKFYNDPYTLFLTDISEFHKYKR